MPQKKTMQTTNSHPLQHYQPLPKPLRTQLENTVKTARAMTEMATDAALHQLAVSEARVPEHLSEKQRVLRKRFRSRARAKCGNSYQNDSNKCSCSALSLQPLIWEVAYEHWHRMLFARFLAENSLLTQSESASMTTI